MTQKGFVKIILIVGIVVILGVVGFLVLFRQTPTPTPIPSPSPESSPKVLDKDLRTLPTTKPWQTGDPIYIVPEGERP